MFCFVFIFRKTNILCVWIILFYFHMSIPYPFIFFPASLRCNWHITLNKFKMFSMIWYLYMLWNDHGGRVSNTYITFSSVQFSHIRLFVTPWITAYQASLSITNSWSSLRLTSIESVMPSSLLILCHPLLLLPPIPPSISLFQWVNSLHEVAKVLEFQL